MVSQKLFTKKCRNNLTRILKIMWDMGEISTTDKIQSQIPNYSVVRRKAEHGYVSFTTLLTIAKACDFTIALTSNSGAVYTLSTNCAANGEVLKKLVKDSGTNATAIANRDANITPNSVARLLRSSVSYNPIKYILKYIPGSRFLVILSPDICLEITLEDLETMPKSDEIVYAA